MRPPNLVPPWGSRTSKLAILGDAPGEWENRLRRPFVGPSGYRLQDWWREVGLTRNDFYLDNCYPFQPPHNNLATISKPEVQVAAEAAVKRIRALPNLQIVIPTGTIALRALLSLPLWQDEMKVGNLRGSVLWRKWGGRRVAIIPTLHPSLTFRRDQLVKVSLLDWKRIAAVLANPRIARPVKRELNFSPSNADIRAFITEVESAPETAVLSIDIETNPTEGELLCVGFALTPTAAISIPWKGHQRAIRRLCESAVPKVGQNFLYDTFWLRRFGIEVRNWQWDTLALNHMRDASLPHDLATQASLYTFQPFWKRDAKDEAKARKLNLSNMQALQRYNCIDACVTLEILHAHLKAIGV